MPALILVTGAAGKTGRAITEALAARGATVRVLVRRPEQVAALRDLGAGDVIVGDIASHETLTQAFQGMTSVYHICPNMHLDEIEIGERVIAAARAPGVQHFVYHSVLHPQTEAMPHHWQKLRVEERLFESGLPFTILQPAPYMQNLLVHRQHIVEAGEVPVPYAAATRLALVDLLDVAAAAADVLLQPGHRDAVYELVGEAALTQAEVAAILSRELSRVVVVREISLKAWRIEAQSRGLAGYQLDSLLRMFRYYEDYGLTGNGSVLRWLLGRQPASLASFVRREFG